MKWGWGSKQGSKSLTGWRTEAGLRRSLIRAWWCSVPAPSEHWELGFGPVALCGYPRHNAEVFTHSLMRWEVPGEMDVPSSVDHAWLRQCGLAAVA